MSWRAFALSALSIVAAVLLTISYVSAGRTPLRKFIITTGRDEPFYVMASEARIEGFCTVYFIGETRIAAVCGQHEWIESEVE